MYDYKYGSTCDQALPNYKPDLVVASGSTSAAAPVITSLVSMMIELEPSLSAQPEVIKAILMASCHRKVKPFGTDTQELITDGLTQKQGAGAVDAYRAIKIVLEGTYGSKTATTYGLNNTATFALSDIDDINVSIAWSRENVNNGILNTTLGTLQELELNLYSGNTLLGSSARTNAGKQMVYLQNLLPNTSYTIKVKKTTNNTEPVTYGYAWSGKNYEQAEMELVVKTAVGRTLTAELSYIDGKAVADEDVTYTWKRSSDGANWQLIPNENTNTYTITSDDWC